MAYEIVKNKLVEYISTSNGLDYTPDMVGCDPSRQDEIKHIALALCGTANYNLADNFMMGTSSHARIEAFFENVSYNGVNSNPIIVKAIQLHLFNLNRTQ